VDNQFHVYKIYIFIGAKELSRVVYSADRGKLETVLLKPGSASAGGNKGFFELQSL
jgi:hypothetical protein